MKKFNVEFGSGEALDEVVTNGSGRKVSYRPFEYCDYMHVIAEDDNGEEVELYAQVDPNEYGFNNGESDTWDEQSTYDDLKELIIKQAVERNVNPDCLAFYLD